MGRKRTRDRKRSRKSSRRRLSRRQLLAAGVTAVGGAGLIFGTGAFTTVTATRNGEVDVAVGDNATIGLDIPSFVVADQPGTRLVTITNRTSHELTFTVTPDSQNQATTSPGSQTVDPTGTATFYTTVESSGPNATLPFTVTGTNNAGYTVTLPRKTGVWGISRVIQDKARNSNARYDFTYRIDGFPDFARLEIEFKNQDYAWATETLSSTDRTGTIVYQRGGAMNTTYEITWTAYDSQGSILARSTITDESDSVNPPGNEDLATPSSPVLDSFTLTDNTKNYNTKYKVEYEVSKLDNFQRVDVTFEDTEKNASWATKTKSSTSAPTGTVTYKQGGTQGDTYEITVKVIDTHGFVVDKGTITDVAGGNNTKTYP